MITYIKVLNTIKANLNGLLAISPDDEWVHLQMIREDFARNLLNPDGHINVESIFGLRWWANGLNREDTLEVVHTLQQFCTCISVSFHRKPIEANDLRVEVLVELLKMQIEFLK